MALKFTTNSSKKQHGLEGNGKKELVLPDISEYRRKQTGMSKIEYERAKQNLINKINKFKKKKIKPKLKVTIKPGLKEFDNLIKKITLKNNIRKKIKHFLKK